VRLFRSLLFQVGLWAILPLLAITAVSVVSIYGHQEAERYLVADRVQRIAHVASGSLANELENKAELLSVLGQGERSGTGATRPPASPDPALHGSFDRGSLWLSATGEALREWGDVSSWRAASAVQDLIERVRTGNASAMAVLPASNSMDGLAVIAVAAPGGGTLIGGFSTSNLAINHLLDDLQLGAQGSGFVVDSSGSILYARGPSVEQVSLPNGHGGLQGASEALAGKAGAFLTENGSDSWAVGYAPVALAGWAVIVRESWADAVGPMARFSVLSPILVILAALVSLVAVYLILNYVIRPLRTLGAMAERVAWGDFAAVELPVAGVQEIRELHGTLRHMVEQIRRYQAGMQNYVTAVTEGQEEERKRLARELHDDTAQSLIGLMQRIKLARRDLKRDPARADERLAELEQLSTATWLDVRRFSEALRPAYLEQFGLEPALGTLTEQVGELAGAPQISFTVKGSVRRLRSEVEVALFRIVQEALSNARQHAQATHVDVTLTYDEHSVAVTVADDGCGFDVPKFPAGLAASGHYGLAGIRERTLLVSGHLEIDSAPGRGTRIRVSVPILPFQTTDR
jgi:signal transduction histidine kinase